MSGSDPSFPPSDIKLAALRAQGIVPMSQAVVSAAVMLGTLAGVGLVVARAQQQLPELEAAVDIQA